MSEQEQPAGSSPVQRHAKPCADPHTIADLLMSAPGMERAAGAMSIADRAALMVAGKAVWDAAVAAERDRWIAKAGATYTDAHAIFNDPPSETPQQVRDVIEWHLYAMRDNEWPNVGAERRPKAVRSMKCWAAAARSEKDSACN